jgi:hypothetical protein
MKNREAPEEGHVTHTRVGGSHGHGMHTVNHALDDKWDHPPMTTDRVHRGEGHETSYPHGGVSSGSLGGNRNEPEGGGVLGHLERAERAMDSPVKDAREMPHKGDTAHAAAVVREIDEIGDTFKSDGVMRR